MPSSTNDAAVTRDSTVKEDEKQKRRDRRRGRPQHRTTSSGDGNDISRTRTANRRSRSASLIRSLSSSDKTNGVPVRSRTSRGMSKSDGDNATLGSPRFGANHGYSRRRTERRSTQRVNSNRRHGTEDEVPLRRAITPDEHPGRSREDMPLRRAVTTSNTSGAPPERVQCKEKDALNADPNLDRRMALWQDTDPIPLADASKARRNNSSPKRGHIRTTVSERSTRAVFRTASASESTLCKRVQSSCAQLQRMKDTSDQQSSTSWKEDFRRSPKEGRNGGTEASHGEESRRVSTSNQRWVNAHKGTKADTVAAAYG